MLLVVCRDKGTAEWAAEPIRIGLEKHPSLAVYPLVLGPHNVPMVTDAARAAEDLPMAVFSAITHSNDHDIAAILDALAGALRATDADAAAVFAEFTEAGLGATPARELWRNLVGTGLSHFRGFVAESFRDEGRLESRGEDILRILAVRGVAVPDEARQRITDCKDLAVLDCVVRAGRHRAHRRRGVRRELSAGGLGRPGLVRPGQDSSRCSLATETAPARVSTPSLS